MGSFNSSREEELLKVIGGEGAQECNALGAQLVGLLAKGGEKKAVKGGWWS